MKLFLILFAFTFSNFGLNQTVDIRLKHYNLDNKLALQGYDLISYFKGSTPVKGKGLYSTSYQGITYYFSSEINKKTFLENPSKYEPQYGGWCAFAMGDYAEKVEINPLTFKILDGKLYLFYNAFLNNTLKTWNKDEANLKIKADKNWLNIINK